MAFFSVEMLSPLVSLTLTVLFLGTLFYLARLNERLSVMRGAQSELRTVLRACSDSVDGAERSIMALRAAAQAMSGDLGRSLEEAEQLKAEIDRTCALANAALARLAEGLEPPAAPTAMTVETGEAPLPAAAPAMTADRPPLTAPERVPVGPGRPAQRQKPLKTPAGDAERAALRLFRETIRAL